MTILLSLLNRGSTQGKRSIQALRLGERGFHLNAGTVEGLGAGCQLRVELAQRCERGGRAFLGNLHNTSLIGQIKSSFINQAEDLIQSLLGRVTLRDQLDTALLAARTTTQNEARENFTGARNHGDIGIGLIEALLPGRSRGFKIVGHNCVGQQRENSFRTSYNIGRRNDTLDHRQFCCSRGRLCSDNNLYTAEVVTVDVGQCGDSGVHVIGEHSIRQGSQPRGNGSFVASLDLDVLSDQSLNSRELGLHQSR